jgi:vWA-MoxR associated protein C-terminal domain
VPVEKPNFERQTVQDWSGFESAIQDILKDFYVDGLLDVMEIHFVADLPLFDRPFHQIPVQPGRPGIGELVVVVIRNRMRTLSQNPRLRENWRSYAAALRGTPPGNIKWVKIDQSGSGLDDRGLCFTCFTLPASGVQGPSSDSELGVLWRLILLGAPYLYVPHAEPVGADWQQLAADLANLSRMHETLDLFPREFANRRLARNPFACQATLLWDDPIDNPFICTRGPRIA